MQESQLYLVYFPCKSILDNVIVSQFADSSSVAGCAFQTSPPAGCIQSKDSTIIMEKDKIRERWTEYIQDLCNSDRDEDFEVECLDEGLDIMKENFLSEICFEENGSRKSSQT